MTVLEQLRALYFAVTQATIDEDFLKAIALFKQLTSDEDREKAAVYMEGIAEMRREWGATRKGGAPNRPGGGVRRAGSKPPSKKPR